MINLYSYVKDTSALNIDTKEYSLFRIIHHKDTAGLHRVDIQELIQALVDMSSQRKKPVITDDIIKAITDYFISQPPSRDDIDNITTIAADIIKQRVPAWEIYIKTIAGAALRYAENCVKGRWREAEPVDGSRYANRY